MSRPSTTLVKATLSALHYTGAGSLLAPFARGQGAIFMLHQVVPDDGEPFAPNGALKVTPEFLDRAIRLVIEAGFEILSLDEMHARLADDRPRERPFACFTLDDGYRDNREYAYPVFKRYGAPFTIYVPADFADGKGDLWWVALERVLRAAPSVTVQMEGELRTFACRTVAEKQRAFDAIYWWLRALPEDRARRVVRDLSAAIGLEGDALCRELVMGWDELRALAADPLVTIGAHTVGHYALAKLPASEARAEIAGSVARIERELGRPCRHFSFPYGDESSAGPREFALAADLGVATATTTRKGLIHAGDPEALVQLPRVSLNGDYQNERYLKVLLSGAPFAIWNTLRRVKSR